MKFNKKFNLVLIMVILLFSNLTAASTDQPWNVTISATNGLEPVIFGSHPDASNGYDLFDEFTVNPDPAKVTMSLNYTYSKMINNNNFVWSLLIGVPTASTTTLTWDTSNVSLIDRELTILNDTASISMNDESTLDLGAGSHEFLISSVEIDKASPIIIFTSPTDNLFLNTSIITITGTASDISGILNVTVNGIPASGTTNWSADVTLSEGENVITVVAVDNAGNSGSITRTITVNNPPILDVIGPKSVDENSTLLFTLTASDGYGNSLAYSAVGLPSGASLDGSSGLFNWTPTYEQSGTHSVQFNVTDGILNDSESVTITVNNVNRAPILNSISTVTINETETATIVLVASDPDSDSLTYSTNATFGNLTGNTFTWASEFDDDGIYYLQFTVNDSVLTDTKTGIIVVGNADRAPVLDSIGPKSIGENSILTFTLNASDPDDDTLIYSAVDLPEGASLDGSSGLFNWTPTYDQAGTYQVDFTVKGLILIDNETVIITVTNVNRAPVLDQIGPKPVDENSTLSFTLTAADADGDSFNYSAVGLPSGASFNVSSGLFTWTPTYEQSGTYPVQFKVTDGTFNDSETVTITVTNVNRAPVLDQIGPKTVDENTTLMFTLTASDADSDSVTYSVVDLPSGASLNVSSGLFNWTPTYDQAGTYPVVFKVTDGTLNDSETVTITVTNVNRAPVLDQIGPKPVDENMSLTFTLTASDADGDSFNYSAVGLPSGASFDVSSGLFTWTPTYEQSGTYPVQFNVTDGTLNDSETVTITVTNVNRAPVLDQIGSKTVDENTTLTFTLAASDADSDSVTYSVVDLPSGASFNVSSGLFNWTPTYDQAGTYYSVFEVTDGTLNDSETVTITVTNVNRAPILTTIGDIAVTELDMASIQVFASDPDGDSLTISNSINMPVTATFNATTNTFTWITTYDTVKYTDSETFTGKITVTDSGGLSNDQTVNITVNNKNRAPTLSPLSNVTIKEGGTFTLSPIAVDLDKDQLTFVYLDVPVGFVGGDGTWKVDTYGNYTINVSVVDSGGLYANQSVAINVTGLPPKLFVVNPVDNVELKSINLKVSGIAYDENLVSLTLLLNDTFSIDLTANVSDIAWFEQNITLNEGTNTLEFNASDASSSTVVTRTVVVNTTKPNNAPVLTITGPLNNSEIISESNVTAVSGHVTDDSGIPNVLVSIGGMDKVVGVSKDGYFGTNVNLAVGQNTITVTATDAGGAIDTETVVVNYTKLMPVDTVDPILILTYPPVGLEVGSEKLLITGYATDNVGIKDITINNGTADIVVVPDSEGVFSEEITLVNGSNTITVTANDTSTLVNSITKTRTVMYIVPLAKDGLIKVEKISLSVSQNSLYADSGNVSNVTAFATDIAGRPANDSEFVEFVLVTNNVVTKNVVQLENGTAVLSVTATEEPQTIIVIASNDTMVLASTQIVVKPNVKIEKIMDNVSITVGGRTAGKSHVVLLDNGVVNIQADPDIISELVNASEDGEVTFTVDVGTGSNLEIKMKNAMLIDGGNLTGEVIGIVLINRPIKTDFTELNGSVGEITFDVNVELNGTTLPGTFTFEMSGHQSIDDVLSSLGGEDAGGVSADTIKENIAKELKDLYQKDANNTHVDNGIAAVIHAQMDGASNDDVNEVPISITLSLDWFNNVAGGDADNVKVFEINETTGEIEAVLDCVVVDNGDGTVTISAIASGFSSYAFTSTTTAPDIESSDDDVPPSSGGGGGGGGGGATGELFENIFVKDVAREYVVKDTPVTYTFKEETNAIGFIKYDAKSNPGEVAVMIEVLKGISTMVSASPSGEVYQNMNIWVGMSGYATETNIANPVIGFKVVKSWITENDIDESTIKLNRYSSGAWNKLPTTKTGEDASYIYFSSETPGFSPFAITGDDRSSTPVSNVPDSSSTASTADDDANELVDETTNVPDDEDKSSGGFALVVGLIGISVLGVGMYLRKDEIGKWIDQRR